MFGCCKPDCHFEFKVVNVTLHVTPACIMRKTSYVVTFAVVALILAFNVISTRRPDWLVVKYEEIFHTRVTVTYGLTQRCELTVSEIPSPSDGGKITYRKYECRRFPASVTDGCDKENEAFCAAWTSAGYLAQIGIGFGSVSLLAILVGVSTHSRRRRIWRAVAGLVLLQAICLLFAFVIVTELYRKESYPTFEHARPGLAYVLHTISWVVAILTTIGVITTGISADVGHQWAAGNRAYQRIGP
ncbi:unnamed protein product [Cyclocybe aegerita]|uniref:Uncharacterized protein n=1 Tax=Cyclocybe aegerita TaxID=1973307 RepID=A0A8S0XQN2_CYCAE|nr:unnamed protein product [Cyclocybe aegerita]